MSILSKYMTYISVYTNFYYNTEILKYDTL